MVTSPFQHPQQIIAALELLVVECGSETLSLPRVLPGLLADLMPDEPQAIRILTAAAEVDVLGQLREHVKRGMDVATAIQLAAVAFADATMFAAQACNWIVSVHAKVAGLAGEYPGRPEIVVSADYYDVPGYKPTQLVEARPPQDADMAPARPSRAKNQPDNPQQVTLTWPRNDSQRIVAALAEVNAIRTAALTEAEQRKATANQKAEQIVEAAQQQAEEILNRAHAILLESQRRQSEIDDLQSAAKAESRRIIDNATRRARQIVAKANQQPSQQPPASGMLRRFGRAQPEPDAQPEPVAKIVRQQPQRQSPTKRSGKR